MALFSSDGFKYVLLVKYVSVRESFKIFFPHLLLLLVFLFFLSFLEKDGNPGGKSSN